MAKVKIKTKKNGKDNTKKKVKKRQSKEEPQRGPTPTSQPSQPHTSAKGGTLIPFASPSKLKNTQLLGDIANKILHRFNPHAQMFALEIYHALELPWDPLSEMGKRELGSFASAWQKSGGMEDDLRARCISEAKKIAKRRQNKKKGAVWNVVFKNLIAAHSKRQKFK